MSAENEQKQPTETEHLVSLLKKCIQAEPDEAALTELGETLLTTVKAVLSRTTN